MVDSSGLNPNKEVSAKNVNSAASQNNETANTQQNAPKPQPPKASKGEVNKDPSLISDTAANISKNLFEATQRANVQKAQNQEAIILVLKDGNKLELDFSKVHSSTLKGLADTDFDEDDDDGLDQILSEQDRNLLAAAFGNAPNKA